MDLLDFYSIVVSIVSFLTITQLLVSMLIIWLSYKTYQFWSRNGHIYDPDHRVFKDDYSLVSGGESYPNTWYPIIRCEDILPGQVKPQYVLEKNLVVYRTITGKVHVLDAFCPHLGANIGVGGSVVGEDIRCPFHSWTFNGQGICTSVPGLEPLNIPKAKLKRWDCVEINGWVYIWYHDQNERPTWMPKEHPELKTNAFCGQFTDYFGTNFCNWYLNGYDESHFKLLHELGGIIGTKHILEKTQFYYLFYKIFHLETRLEVPEQINWKESSDTPHLEIVIHLVPVLFGFPLKNYRVIVNNTQHPPNIFTDVTIPFAREKFYISTASVPLAPRRWRITMEFYTANPTLLSKCCAKFGVKFFHDFGNADYIIFQNMKTPERPCYTKMDITLVKAYRFMFEHYFSRKIPETNEDFLPDLETDLHDAKSI